MDLTSNCPVAEKLAQLLREHREPLTRRWLDRIADRVAIDPMRIFPTNALLDHVPLLIDGVASYIADPAQPLVADMPVIAKAMELGALRHTQGFDEYELLKEYEILGGVLFAFIAQSVGELEEECSRSELVLCTHRLYVAVSLMQQATTMQFLALMKDRLREREERLRAFNRALTHELRNRIGATMGAAQLLQMPEVPDGDRERLVHIVADNMEGMKVSLDNLLELTRLSNANARQQRHVLLASAVAEVVRQLRDFASARGVQVVVDEATLPPVEVNAAAVELCLTNFVSNAIKYADDAKEERWVEVAGRVRPSAPSVEPAVIVEVRDNGRGVPPAMRDRLFERFFRAGRESITGLEGTGLGLSIVRETVQSLGGDAWAEFPATGSVFAFSLPVRRLSDPAPAAPQPAVATA